MSNSWIRTKPPSLILKSKPTTALTQSHSSTTEFPDELTPNECTEEDEIPFIESESDQKSFDSSPESATTAVSEFYRPSPSRKMVKRLSSAPGGIIPYDVLSLLHTLPFFAGLDQSEEFIDKISRILKLRKYQTGDVVITQGETAKAMFFIIKGLLKVISDDGEIELAELTCGNYFGEIGILFEVQRTATVVAKSPCTLLTLTAEKVSQELHAYPEIGKNVLAIAQNRLLCLAKEYEKSGKKISSDITRQLSQIGAAADIPTPLSVGQTRTHWLEDLKLANVGKEVEEEDEKEEDVEDIIPFEKKDTFKLITSATILSKKLTERRRASVAVWTDAKLLDFAKSIVGQVPAKESRFAAMASNVSLNSIPSLSAGNLVLDVHMNGATLNSLDANLVAKVFRYFDLDTLNNTRRVSKLFSAVAKDKDHNLYSLVNLTPFSKKINNENLERLLMFIGSNIHRLILKNCWSVTDRGLFSISQYCPILVHLDLSSAWDITDAGLLKISEVAQYLEAINLSNCRKITDQGVSAILQKAPGMLKIQVSYCKNLTGNVMAHPVWSSMKEVNFQRATGIRDDGFLSWKSLCVTSSISYFALEDLNLSDCSFLTDASIQVLGSKCPQLKRLCLSFCCSLTEKFATFLVEGCPFIQILDSSYCGGAVTDAAVKVIAQGLPRMHSLGVRCCVLLTDQGMEDLATHALSLHTLNFTQCKNVSSNICKKLGIEWNCISTSVYFGIE